MSRQHHDHEDHIGANRPIQERFGINIYTPADAEIKGGQSECARGRREKERNNGIGQHGGKKMVVIVE